MCTSDSFEDTRFAPTVRGDESKKVGQPFQHDVPEGPKVLEFEELDSHSPYPFPDLCGAKNATATGNMHDRGPAGRAQMAAAPPPGGREVQATISK